VTKILATGDLHLHEWPGLAPVDRLADQETVLDRIVDLARQHGVDAVLIAGDVFHRPQPSPRVLQAFRRFAGELAHYGREVVAITGNASHDIENADRFCALELFDDIVSVHRTPGVWLGPGVEVACLPSVPVARLVAMYGGGDRDELNADAADLLLRVAADLRAQIREFPAILLGHWSVSGASFPNGLPVDAAREPVIPADGLADLGFDYTVFGHIHKAQEIPDGFYVGSPMPLDFGEAGIGNHGVFILDTNEREVVDAKGAQFVPIESRRFVTLDLDADDLAGDVVKLYNGDGTVELEDAIVRVRYTATAEQARGIDNADIRATLVDAGAARVTIEPDIVREDRARVQGLDDQLGELDAVDMYVSAQEWESERADRLRTVTGELLEGASA
jgi:exonuclease SbcD